MQDEYAIESYRRAEKANTNNWYQGEIDPIELVDKKTKEKQLMTNDEEYKHVIYEKITKLKPVTGKL